MRARRSILAMSAVACLAAATACDDPSIESTTQLESTADTTGPYRVHSVVHGAHDDDRVELFYNPIDDSPSRYFLNTMRPLDDDGQAGELFAGQIPGQPAGTTIRYFVAVYRDGERVAEDPVGGDLRPFVLSIEP